MKPQLSFALFYMLFGAIFTFFAIQQVSISGWGVMAILLVLLATYDLGSGIQMMISYFRRNKNIKPK